MAAAVALAACSANDPPGGEGRLSIATGGSGGVYQVYGGRLADVLSEELPDSPTTAETTSATVDNLLRSPAARATSPSRSATRRSTPCAATRRSPARSRCGRSPRCTPTITQVVVKADLEGS